MRVQLGVPLLPAITGSRTLALARSANLVRQPVNPIAHTTKVPDDGRVRRPNPLVFEKSQANPSEAQEPSRAAAKPVARQPGCSSSVSIVAEQKQISSRSNVVSTGPLS